MTVPSPDSIKLFTIDMSPIKYTEDIFKIKMPCLYMAGYLGKLVNSGSIWRSEGVEQRWFILKGPYLACMFFFPISFDFRFQSAR